MKQSQTAGPSQAPTPALSGPEPEPDAQSQYGNAFVASQVGQEPGPDAGAAANLDVDRPVGGDVPTATRDGVLGGVGATPRGRQLLDQIRTARGDLNIPTKWSNQGTYHSAGSIWLDRNTSEDSWQGSMAHELVHLLTFVSGQAADAATMTRDAFVAAKMTDEINAQATAYVVTIQSGSLTGELGLADFVTWLGANRPELATSPSDADADAHWTELQEVARTWIEGKYRSEWTTSNTHENYYTYWGGYWDSLHP